MPLQKPLATTSVPSGLVSDGDAARLLTKIGATITGVALTLLVSLAFTGSGFRPAAMGAVVVGGAMLLLVRSGHLRAAGYTLCWGLLVVGVLGVNKFGLRSTGSLVLPLSIMAGAWLLGRFAAAALAGASSLVAIWVYVEQLQGKVRPTPSVIEGDLLAYLGMFGVTALVGVAMAATLRVQFEKANALAIRLQEANANLEQRVAERSAQLADMQKNAMESERLTSLGSMVAGISHELNTPLGNALTVFLSGAAEMSSLATQSITRAADLVASFKQVAVDQTSEQRRPFLLDRVVSDNVAALMPSLGRIQVKVEQEIPAGIQCDSFPGPLGQVLTNLVQNAAVHGFEGKAGGHIRITAKAQDNQVELIVADDGVGMDKKVLMHVFDPFFTTRLGKGGSGLGLSVSFRIATSVLGGSLSARAEPGQGSSFTLTFPLKAPAAIIDP
jgi:signal transduction histidine kinase